jgi:hypothetical protein
MLWAQMAGKSGGGSQYFFLWHHFILVDLAQEQNYRHFSPFFSEPINFDYPFAIAKFGYHAKKMF